jgi:hypothetical protein
MPAGDNNSPLITALAALVELDPERGGMVLRKAIAALVADDTRPLGRVSTKDAAAWTQIRRRLREAMAADKLTARQLGEQLELSESAIDKCAAPNGPVPSNDIIARVQRWLTSRDTENTRPPAAVNGHVVDRRPHGGRLSEVERERLAAHVQFTAERELRQALGLTSLIITQAISGAELPAEAIERITGFLEAG